jgi:hypothetical protein
MEVAHFTRSSGHLSSVLSYVSLRQDFESSAAKREKDAQQVVTHQPAISFSISIHFPFNRAGGRTSNVSPENEDPHPTTLGDFVHLHNGARRG